MKTMQLLILLVLTSTGCVIFGQTEEEYFAEMYADGGNITDGDRTDAGVPDAGFADAGR